MEVGEISTITRPRATHWMLKVCSSDDMLTCLSVVLG